MVLLNQKKFMKNKYVINWELSLACNLDCTFCSQKERRNINSKIPDKVKIFKIIDNLPDNTHISFLWWETLLIPYILEVFDKLEESKISYEITTNWILIENYVKELSKLNFLSQINISIDWYGDFHDISRWKKWLFRKLMKCIPELIKSKKISISTVISPNITNENIVKLHLWLNNIWIIEHKLIYMMNFSKIDVDNSKKQIKELKIWLPWSEKLDNEMLKKDFLEKVTILKKLNTNTKLIIEPIALFKKWNIWCKQLVNQLRIDENGKLSICEFITNNFDDISKMKLEDAVKNNDFMEFKKLIKSKFPLDICKTCCKLYEE